MDGGIDIGMDFGAGVEVNPAAAGTLVVGADPVGAIDDVAESAGEESAADAAGTDPVGTLDDAAEGAGAEGVEGAETEGVEGADAAGAMDDGMEGAGAIAADAGEDGVAGAMLGGSAGGAAMPIRVPERSR